MRHNNIAVFTQVKNERWFLPVWIHHYQQFFDSQDLYVLDHESDDGSTNELPVNRIITKNPFVADNHWRIRVVESFQQFLLCSYDCVIYTDVDEIIYSAHKPLNEYLQRFIKKSKDSHITCHGYELFQEEREKQLEPGDLIMQFRTKWYRNKEYYDKPLVSKAPLKWEWGFHNLKGIKKRRPSKFKVFLLHLHKMDKELMIQRHIERTTNHQWKNDGGSWHYQSTKEGALNHFYSLATPLRTIPERHKRALNHLRVF